MDMGLRFLRSYAISIISQACTQRCDVLDQIVGSAVQLHASSNSAKISIDLRVAEPEEGEEEEYRAGVDGTGNFLNELVIPSNLRRAFAFSVVGYGS